MNSTNSILKTGNGTVEFDGKRLPLYKSNNAQYFLDSIPVSLLERDEEAQPRPYDKFQAQKIADSIQKKVLMQPLLTRFDKKKQKFLITEGQHRWRAMQDVLNEKRVPCIVYIDLDDHTAQLCGLEANAEDRARPLSGGDVARKTSSLMLRYEDLIRKENPEQPVTELAILKRMGKTAKAQQKKFLLGRIIQDLRDLDTTKIAPFISDRQSSREPITALNFSFFLQRMVKVSALDSTDNFLREEELVNVIRVTNIFAEAVFENNKWSPEKPESKSHKHAVNVSRRHPFEACGHFISKLVEHCGGRECTIGACFSESANINWERFEKSLVAFLNSQVWDKPYVFNCRGIDELKNHLQSAYNASIAK